MISRLEGWERALADYFKSCETAEFVWGEHDCSMFVSNAVLAMTGRDPAAVYRGTYSDAESAQKILEKHGGITGVGDWAFGERVAALMLQRGDVAAIPNGDGQEAIGIVSLDGQRVHAIMGEGYGSVPVADALFGWRV